MPLIGDGLEAAVRPAVAPRLCHLLGDAQLVGMHDAMGLEVHDLGVKLSLTEGAVVSELIGHLCAGYRWELVWANKVVEVPYEFGGGPLVSV